jgi:hypothetical protein
VHPSFADRGEGVGPNATRRWLLSIKPREGNRWPRSVTPEQWGKNGANSLSVLILRYRLDGCVQEMPPHIRRVYSQPRSSQRPF